MLVGAPRESGGAEEKYYNSAFLLSDEGRVIDHYDKLHLVPFGEYIPLKRVFSFVDKFAPMPIGDFTAGDSYKVFRFFIEKKASAEKGIWRLIKKVSFSCLICFEDIFPDLARNFVKEDAAFLVNITNDAWFGFSSAPYQHAENSVFRAVENRVNVVRSANTGLSCFIDQKGQISETVGKEKGEIFVEGFAVRDIILTPTRTFYTAYGDIFAFGCVLLAFYPCTRKPRV
jgi:apolipoprotein N-acyltransferase